MNTSQRNRWVVMSRMPGQPLPHRAVHALRKQTVEPVFGIIKSVMGFRQFLLRGLKNVRNERTLACRAWKLKRMAALRPQ